MREIKFRAWDIIKKEWADIGLYSKFIYDMENGFFNTQEGPDGASWHESVKDERLALEQYTGLKDKNGKEIYEGDIVSGKEGDFVSNVIGQLIYRGLSFCFEGMQTDKKYEICGEESAGFWRYTITSPGFDKLSNIEIIGNIHENPELLK